MRPTDPQPPYPQRSSEELLEDLCLRLRDVGVNAQFLAYRPPDSDLSTAIERVREIDSELRKRAVDPNPRLNLLAQETGWMMPTLYQECAKWPTIRPWVRDLKDGLRIALRCPACGKAEHPEDARDVRLCDDCLGILDSALATKTVRDHLLLYRTFNREARCDHADDETVLGVYPWSPEWSDDFPVGICRTCIGVEGSRRRSRPTGR